MQLHTDKKPSGILQISATKTHAEINWDQVNKALAWNLDGPISFLVKRENHKLEVVEQMALEYRRFLGIIAAYPNDRFPISEAVDELWHTHILFTRDYRAMSDEIRGEYINHDPILTLEQKRAVEPYYYKGTLVRYHELYREAAPRYWWPIEEGAICWSGYTIVPISN